MENVMGKLEEKLSAPSSEYRSVPFWSWNDELVVFSCMLGVGLKLPT